MKKSWNICKRSNWVKLTCGVLLISAASDDLQLASKLQKWAPLTVIFLTCNSHHWISYSIVLDKSIEIFCRKVFKAKIFLDFTLNFSTFWHSSSPGRNGAERIKVKQQSDWPKTRGEEERVIRTIGARSLAPLDPSSNKRLRDGATLPSLRESQSTPIKIIITMAMSKHKNQSQKIWFKPT